MGLRNYARIGVIVGLLAGPFLVQSTVHGMQFNSTNFTIDTSSIGNSISGPQSSTNYRLVSSGGASIIGDGASGSYKLGHGYVPQLEKSLQLTTQPNGLEAYYSLDEPSGTVAYDSSSNSRNGAYSANPTIVSGKVGQARSLNGSSQGVLIPDFDISGTITYSAWIYPTAASQTGKIIAKNSATTDAQALMGLTNGQIFAVTTVGGSGQFIYGPTPALNKWVHVAAMYDGSATRLYVNGAQVASFATSGALANNNHSWGIGRNGNNSGGYFTGTIDEVKIYNRALNAAEVMAEYRAGLNNITAGFGLGTVTPGVSQTATFDGVVQTDAPGYSLLINQDHDLNTSGDISPSKNDTYNSITPETSLSSSNTSADAIVLTNTATATARNINNPLHGTYASFSTGGTASTSYQRDIVSDSKVFVRFYVRFNAIPSSTMTVWNMYNGSNSLSGVVVDSSGKIHLRNVFASLGSTSYTVSPDSWIRIEVMWDRENTTQQLRLYHGANVEGTVPNEIITGVANSTDTTSSSMRTGVVNGMVNHINDIDDLAIDTRTWIGPAIAADSIAPVNGSITTPNAWVENTTKGLGFTLYGTTATALPGKWGSGANYAAIPNSPTSFYTRTGYTGGVKDVHNLRLRLDAPVTQAVGDYNNQMTITGTMTP